MARRGEAVPLNELQTRIARLLAPNRRADSYLAGGAALHFSPVSIRYSNDLDYFNDSEERVAQAFDEDNRLLAAGGFEVQIELNRPGYVRAIVSRDDSSTKVEWAHDSAWRFMPTQPHPDLGFVLHPLDLALNKLLALATRDEPRDYLDVMYAHDSILPLGALCWAAVGKDPGFSPASLLSLLKRRGKYQPNEFSRLHLVQPINLTALKERWLGAIASAGHFIETAEGEIGCLFFDCKTQLFCEPSFPLGNKVARHFGRPGGVLPTFLS